MFWTYVLVSVFYGIPAAALVFFGVSLFLFCHGRHRNQVCPGSVPDGKMRVRRICLIVSAVIAGILTVIVGGFTALLLMAVAYM